MKKILLLTVVFLSIPFFASAENYDFYVDKNYSGPEIGSQEKPFQTMKKAIEKASQERAGSRRIYVSNGEYEEELNVTDSVKLFGQDKEKTIVKLPNNSTTNLSGNNVIKNMTFSGGTVALTVNGTTIIENCIIRDARKKGIDLPEGDSLVKITNSSIVNNGGKGVYIQKGRSVLLQGNSVTSNIGEGFDIRQNIHGVIMANEIKENTESGIEILASASDVLIKNNIIKNNRANGIANQSYPDMPDLGKINIIENTLTGNGKYGVYCGAPSGGTKTKTFFSESILLEKNINETNAGKPISGSCHFERQTQDHLKNISSDIESKINRQAAEHESYYSIESEIDWLITSSRKIENEIKNEGFFRKIFLGINKDKLELIRSNTAQISKLAKDAETVSEDISNQAIKSSFYSLLDSAEKEISNSDVFIRKSNRLNKIFWLPRSIAGIFR